MSNGRFRIGSVSVRGTTYAQSSSAISRQSEASSIAVVQAKLKPSSMRSSKSAPRQHVSNQRDSEKPGAVHVGMEPGRMKDFEPGTEFYMRQDKRK